MYAGGNDPRDKADYLYGTCHVPSAGLECTTAERDQITAWDEEADNAQIPGQIIMGAGGVFLAAGATLIVLSALSDDAPSQAGLNVNPWVSLNGAGLSGTF